jgi:hypothetical protein
MQLTLIVTLVLHVLSGVFWAGTTFVLARTDADHADQLFFPQRGAAAVAVLTGGVLWYLLHRGHFDTNEQILAVGIGCAVIAGGVQFTSGRAALKKDPDNAQRLQRRLVTGQRIAAGLLAITVACMAAARYA